MYLFFFYNFLPLTDPLLLYAYKVSPPSRDNSVKTALGVVVAVVCLAILCVIALSAPYLRNMQGHSQEPSTDLGG